MNHRELKSSTKLDWGYLEWLKHSVNCHNVQNQGVPSFHSPVFSKIALRVPKDHRFLHILWSLSGRDVVVKWPFCGPCGSLQDLPQNRACHGSLQVGPQIWSNCALNLPVPLSGGQAVSSWEVNGAEPFPSTMVKHQTWYQPPGEAVPPMSYALVESSLKSSKEQTIPSWS